MSSGCRLHHLHLRPPHRVRQQWNQVEHSFIPFLISLSYTLGCAILGNNACRGEKSTVTMKRFVLDRNHRSKTKTNRGNKSLQQNDERHQNRKDRRKTIRCRRRRRPSGAAVPASPNGRPAESWSDTTTDATSRPPERCGTPNCTATSPR